MTATLLMILAAFPSTHAVDSTATNTGCPLCPAIGAQTIGEGLTSMDVAAFVRLSELREDPADDQASDQANAQFEIVEVLFGEAALNGSRVIELDYYGSREVGTEFLLAAIDPLNLTWNDPILMSERGKEYVREVWKLPTDADKRLSFFLSKLEDSDPVIASDAYDEFARAPYADVLAISDQYDRGQLLKWIQNEEIPMVRKRLYFMLLGICGTEEEVPALKEMILAAMEEKRIGLDSILACYLSLAGPDGLELIDNEMLKNKDAGYSQTYAAIMALRFHGTDGDAIERSRIVESMRLLLDRPGLADLVIPDLARWEDWDSAARLMKLFRDATPEDRFVRVPIVIYMRLCPNPEAKEYLEEIKRIDPKAIEKADLTYAFGG